MSGPVDKLKARKIAEMQREYGALPADMCAEPVESEIRIIDIPPPEFMWPSQYWGEC